MSYDFLTKPQREGMDAIAVDSVGKLSWAPGAPREGFSLIPMWVADMNFKAFPGITESIIRRAEHPSFGYFEPRDAYYEAIANWQWTRNDADVPREAIGYENGVLGGVLSAVRALCSPGDKILLHSPTYVGFTGSLTSNGYHLVYSSLVPDENGVWRMDFEDMEKKLREEHIHVLVFCSPHNPCGRVWEIDELIRLSDICQKYQVTVLSDEIWSDLVLPGFRHIPTQSAAEYLHENTAAFYAPTKTFNLAGLVGSYHIIYDRRLRDRVRREGELSHYNSMNVFSMHALMGAYTREGMEWTDELCEVIEENARIMGGFFRGIGGVFCPRIQGTYMLFPDFREYCKKTGRTMDEILKACWDAGVAVQDGRGFRGEYNIRANLALPSQYVEEACKRLERYVFG